MANNINNDIKYINSNMEKNQETYGTIWVWGMRLAFIIPSIYCVILSTQVNLVVFFITFALAVIKNIFVMRITNYSEALFHNASFSMTAKENDGTEQFTSK